jgi:BASS family bile acid:Na+ symporter
MLMVSVGMSLDVRELLANWRRLTPVLWAKLLLATFLVPPACALAMGTVLPIGLPALAGLFLVSVAPGAPLMTRGAAKRGFNMQMAASYQVWGALLTPLMIPVLVAAASSLYGHGIWLSPLKLLRVIALQQFVPLLAGLALVHWWPRLTGRLQRPLNLLGNLLLTVGLLGLLWKLGPALRHVSPWVAVAALLLAVACMAAGLLLLGKGTATVQTLAVSNVNRHVGLAMLLTGQDFHNPRMVPAIAAYALAAMLVMAVFARIARRGGMAATDGPAAAPGTTENHPRTGPPGDCSTASRPVLAVRSSCAKLVNSIEPRTPNPEPRILNPEY